MSGAESYLSFICPFLMGNSLAIGKLGGLGLYFMNQDNNTLTIITNGS